MKTLDQGHRYILDAIDNGTPQHLAFVKREGDNYPGNDGHYGGTQAQEVIRALIERTIYVNAQIPHAANEEVVEHLRFALLALEQRAAQRHGLEFDLLIVAGEEMDILGGIDGRAIEQIPVCETCGHIVCHHQATKRPGSIYGFDWRQSASLTS
jgi:hypothetical protein